MFFQGKCKVDYLVDCIPAAEHSDQVHLVAGAYSGDLHLLDVTDPDEIIVVKSLENGHSDTVRCLHWDKEVWILCDFVMHICGWWWGGDVLHMVTYVHTDDSAKWGKSNNYFQFVTFINRFLSDGSERVKVFSHKY